MGCGGSKGKPEPTLRPPAEDSPDQKKTLRALSDMSPEEIQDYFNNVNISDIPEKYHPIVRAGEFSRRIEEEFNREEEEKRRKQLQDEVAKEMKMQAACAEAHEAREKEKREAEERSKQTQTNREKLYEQQRIERKMTEAREKAEAEKAAASSATKKVARFQADDLEECTPGVEHTSSLRGG